MGATRERFAALWRFGAEDLSVGRLAEAHTDAVAIRAEAGLDHDPRLLLGVWASGGPSNRVIAEPVTGGWRLRGRRSWCSGAALLDQALLTVDAADDQLLLTVDLDRPQLVIDPTTWTTPALAATATATVTFDGVIVPTEGLVGGPGFYGDRPGFWAGSVGVAAVWAGGADGVVAALRDAVAGDDPHALAHLGAAETASWTMQAALAAAADEIDADPTRCAPARRGPGADRPPPRRTVVPGDHRPQRTGARTRSLGDGSGPRPTGDRPPALRPPRPRRTGPGGHRPGDTIGPDTARARS